MKNFRLILVVLSVALCNSFHSADIGIGSKIDALNGVDVYFNGHDFTNVSGRNVTKDGYNVGLKFQCVEFVKRYYYQVLHHKMPHAFGHAKDFFDKNLPDKSYNIKRDLMQYRNVREYRPKVDDILVYDKSPENPFGHVAIISYAVENEIEIVQQNMGLVSRKKIPLVNFYEYWTVADYHILGWLRKE